MKISGNDKLISIPNNNLLKICIFISAIILAVITIPQLEIFEKFDYSVELAAIEDGPIEYATSLVLFGSFILSLLISNIFFKKNKKTLGIIYLILAVGFLFWCFEELSWAQRIFNIETPEILSDNRQNETNLHNLIPIEISYTSTFLIGLYGAIAWIFVRRENTTPSIRYFVPNWFFSSLFFPYHFHKLILEAITYEPLSYYHREEFFEMSLPIGIIIISQ